MITIVLMLTQATMTIVIEVMIAFVRMTMMDGHICMIFEQNDDYKLVLGATCHHKRAH